VRSASTKAASKLKTAASKRRMSQTAAGAVSESEHEIERIEAELEGLARELQDEIDRIAAESEEMAEKITTVAVKPKKADIEIIDLRLIWR
jgi:t-SNARE complex subunit (syntaxin)